MGKSIYSGLVLNKSQTQNQTDQTPNSGETSMRIYHYSNSCSDRVSYCTLEKEPSVTSRYYIFMQKKKINAYQY